MRRFRLAAVCLFLATCSLSCVETWKKPGVNAADFDRDQTECLDEAYLQGPLIHQRAFEECMEDRGYRRD